MSIKYEKTKFSTKRNVYTTTKHFNQNTLSNLTDISLALYKLKNIKL